MKKIAFFIQNWTLTSYIIQLAEAVGFRGVPVEIFFEGRLPPLVDAARIERCPNLRLIPLKEPFWPPRTENDCRTYLQEVSAIFQRHAQGRKYGAFIGVEKPGIALACINAKMMGVPYFYWSVELYDMKHPIWPYHMPFPEYWLKMEAVAHKTAAATIIQDKDRAEALERLTERRGPRLYLPITVSRSEVISGGSHALHDLCNLPHERKLLLQFGNNRLPPDWILRMAESLPEPWTLVLHGLHLEALRDALCHPHLAVSTTRQPEDAIPALISSAAAGLVHYNPTHINDELTARSSEKLARYLGAGIPVLAHDIGNFSKVFGELGCGITYKSPEQAGQVIRLLERNEDLFRKAALRAGQQYIFEEAGQEVVDMLCGLASA